MSKIGNVSFKNVTFISSKLLGLHFEQCNLFGFEIHFDNCQINLSSFYKIDLKHCSFKDSSLQEVDFTEVNLAQKSFENCDLLGAIFENTNLEKCDFRSAFNYIIDPQNNKIKKAKFSKEGAIGLLRAFDIVIG
ncbi:MAG: pentapeptide repeat-containing protein [Flavobacteriia bacterium]